jgi:tRNA-splicing ligase RtcB
MNTEKLMGKDLLEIGFPENKALGVALKVMNEFYRETSKEDQLDILKKVLTIPQSFIEHTLLAPIADALMEASRETTIPLKEEKQPYKIYGAEAIEQGAINQMEIAMKLPVTVAGALMPDAHQGYGLPIGGVLATKNAVIPYGVGVDIGCRMCMSIYDLPEKYLEENREPLKKLLIDQTKFGKATFKKPKEHAVIDRAEFREI